MSAALEAYKRAFHCGVGGHDGHPDDGIQLQEHQLMADRCALAVEWSALRQALNAIASIPNNPGGGDWDEIELARTIAKKALGETE